MSGMDRLTDEALECVSDGSVIVSNQRVWQMARELLAHRRASQAAPAPSDGLREAEARQAECHLHAMLLAAEVAEACGPSDEWSQETKDTYYFAVRDAARAIRKTAALTPEPAQEGGE